MMVETSSSSLPSQSTEVLLCSAIRSRKAHMFARTISSSAKHNTDVEFIETFEEKFFSGVTEQPRTDFTFPDRPLLEVTVCGATWKRETKTTNSQLEGSRVRAMDQLKAKDENN